MENKPIQQSREDRYVKLYGAVEVDMINMGLIKESLMELCSVALDRQGKENLINFEFLLDSPLESKIELKKSFDKHAKQQGFEVNYANLMGDLY